MSLAGHPPTPPTPPPRPRAREQLAAGAEPARALFAVRAPPRQQPPPIPLHEEEEESGLIDLRALAASTIASVRSPPEEAPVPTFFVFEPTAATPPPPAEPEPPGLFGETPPVATRQAFVPVLVPEAPPSALVPKPLPPKRTRSIPVWAWAILGGLIALGCAIAGAALVLVTRPQPAAANAEPTVAVRSDATHSETTMVSVSLSPLPPAAQGAPSGSAGRAATTRDPAVAPPSTSSSTGEAVARKRSLDPQRPAADSERRSPRKAPADVDAVPSRSATPHSDSTSHDEEAAPPAATERPAPSVGFATAAGAPIPAVVEPAHKTNADDKAADRPAASAKSREKKADEDDLVALLEGTRSAARETAAPSREKADSSDLPERLDNTDVTATMRRLRPEIDACFARYHIAGTAMVRTVIAGTGRVESASVTGMMANTPTAECITTAVRGAGFKRFSGRPMMIDYPFVLR